MRKHSNTKTPPKTEKKTEGRKKKENSLAPSTVKTGAILKYLQTKKTEEEKKTTFDNVINTGVSQRVKNFNKMSESTKCVIGSGFCAGHNVKLVRSVRTKKTSCVDDNGEIKWLMREVTSLTCPAVSAKILTFSDAPARLTPGESGTTNGKRRKLSMSEMNQPQHCRTYKKDNED